MRVDAAGELLPGELESYARCAARLRGLEVAEESWAGVLRALALVMRLGDDLEVHNAEGIGARPRADA